jgi:hypothetical protein
MRDPILCGVVGKKRHGKDTIGKALHSHLDLRVDHFAAPIKDFCRDVMGLSFAQVHGDKKETVDPRWGKTPREIMQFYGAEVVRSIHPDVWVRRAIDDHHYYTDRARQDRPRIGTVICDCRYQNEADAIRKAGGFLLYVVRPGIEDNEHSAHSSEQEIERIGATAEIQLVNDGTPAELQARAVVAVRELLGV